MSVIGAHVISPLCLFFQFKYFWICNPCSPSDMMEREDGGPLFTGWGRSGSVRGKFDNRLEQVVLSVCDVFPVHHP